ncbi:hypothetical protein HK101_003080 [Irineochytrium annulatum]|nr:hypothetical protein HK101_003080 [Irineochytrium annulatum]
MRSICGDRGFTGFGEAFESGASELVEAEEDGAVPVRCGPGLVTAADASCLRVLIGEGFDREETSLAFSRSDEAAAGSGPSSRLGGGASSVPGERLDREAARRVESRSADTLGETGVALALRLRAGLERRVAEVAAGRGEMESAEACCAADDLRAGVGADGGLTDGGSVAEAAGRGEEEADALAEIVAATA